MIAGRIHGPYYQKREELSGVTQRDEWFPKAGGQVWLVGKVIKFEREDGKLYEINASNFFTSGTPEENLRKHFRNAVKDSEQWKKRPSFCAHSLEEVVSLVLHTFPTAKCVRKGKVKVFKDPQVLAFIHCLTMGDTCGLALPHSVDPSPEGARVKQSEAQPVREKQPAISVSIIGFHRHPQSLRDALLGSELAKEALASGIEIEPEWANGAKIFAPISQSLLPEDVTLKAYHAVILTEDLPRLEAILQQFSCKERPRIKTTKGVLVQDDSPQGVEIQHTDVWYEVVRTFVHVPEPGMTTPRSRCTKSTGDARPSHKNPRTGDWPGCQWVSCAEASSSAVTHQPCLSQEERWHKLKVCQRSQDLPGALECYSNMLRDDVEPNVQVFTILVDICAKTNQPEEAERWMETMTQKGVPWDKVAMNCVINAWAQAGNGKNAERWFNEMLGQNIKPSLITYNCLIRAYAKGKDLTNALKWHQEALAATGKLDVYSYLPLLLYYCAEGLPLKAEQCFFEMKDAGIAVQRSIFQPVIGAYANAKDLEGAKRWCRRSIPLVGPLEVHEYTLLLRACTESSQAEAVFKQQLRAHIKPDFSNWEALEQAVGGCQARKLCKQLNVDLDALRRTWEAQEQELGRKSFRSFELAKDGLFKKNTFSEESY